MCGAYTTPVYETVNIFTSALTAFFFMGYMFRYRPVWYAAYPWSFTRLLHR